MNSQLAGKYRILHLYLSPLYPRAQFRKPLLYDSEHMEYPGLHGLSLGLTALVGADRQTHEAVRLEDSLRVDNSLHPKYS